MLMLHLLVWILSGVVRYYLHCDVVFIFMEFYIIIGMYLSRYIIWFVYQTHVVYRNSCVCVCVCLVCR